MAPVLNLLLGTDERIRPRLRLTLMAGSVFIA
jgi:hypothetical protein